MPLPLLVSGPPIPPPSAISQYIPKRLAQFVGPTSNTTYYTTPANTITIIKNIFVANTSSAYGYFSLSVIPVGGSVGFGNRILPGVMIPAHGFASWDLSTVMAAGDFINAGTAYASTFTVTISGVETSTTNSVYVRRLAQVMPTNTSETSMYSVPASTNCMVNEILIANNSGSTQSVDLSIVPNGQTAGDSNRLLSAASIASNSVTVLKMMQAMSTADFISAKASIANLVTFTISGVEFG